MFIAPWSPGAWLILSLPSILSRLKKKKELKRVNSQACGNQGMFIVEPGL